MAPFSHYPSEIIHHIFRFLSEPDLATVFLIKPLRCHAERALYSTIEFDWDELAKPQVINLLCTFLQRPELFAYISSFSLIGDEGDESAPSSLKLEIPPDLALDQFTTAVEKIQAPYTDIWVEKLRAGIQSVPERSTTEIEKLRHLAYIRRIDKPADNHDDLFNEVVSAFYLPTVTDVALWMHNPATFHWPLGEPNLCHLTSLHIEWLCPEFLSRILTLTENLKFLDWSWDYITKTGDTWKPSTLDFDELTRALSPVKHTLEKLRIGFRSGFGRLHGWPPVTISGSFASLVDFHKVKELYMPFIALAGFGSQTLPSERHLPHTVEELSLSIDMIDDSRVGWKKDEEKDLESTIISLVTSLVENCPTRLPRLESVRVFVDTEEYGYSHIGWKMEKLSLGVDVKVIDNNRQWFDRYMGP